MHKIKNIKRRSFNAWLITSNYSLSFTPRVQVTNQNKLYSPARGSFMKTEANLAEISENEGHQDQGNIAD